VLVVEDEFLITMMIEPVLADLGCEITGTAATVSEALDLVNRSDADVAILDIKLGSETCYPVATALAERGTPLVLTTGYAGLQVEQPWRGIPRVTKPFTADQLADALALTTADRPRRLAGDI
jgi:CheY-like chemotaxis protein